MPVAFQFLPPFLSKFSRESWGLEPQGTGNNGGESRRESCGKLEGTWRLLRGCC